MFHLPNFPSVLLQLALVLVPLPCEIGVFSPSQKTLPSGIAFFFFLPFQLVVFHSFDELFTSLALLFYILFVFTFKTHNSQHSLHPPVLLGKPLHLLVIHFPV